MTNVLIPQIAECLTQRLPPTVRHAKIQVYPAKNSIRLYYPEFDSSYYEVCLTKTQTDIAFHFAGSRTKIASRLALMETHLYTLRQNLGHPLTVTNEGRIALQLVQDQTTETTAEQMAGLMLNFLDLTYPLLRNIFETVPIRSQQQETLVPVLNPDHFATYAILSRHLDRIHTFLQGRSARPSDDVLCDWLQLCYTVELYQEGADLFNLISPAAVQPPLYERVQRMAKVCRLRAKK